VENKYEFPLIGGDREDGETGLEALIREVKEESMGKIQLDLNDLNKIKKIGEFINPEPSKLGEKIVNMLQLRVIYSQNKCENLAKLGIFASFLAVWFRVRI
jgi:hypothetical protein